MDCTQRSEPPPLSRLVYTAPGNGHGEVHTLIMIEDGMATTWGDKGHSWHGPMDLFSQVFSPAPEGS